MMAYLLFNWNRLRIYIILFMFDCKTGTFAFIWDVIQGVTKVPSATQEYNKNYFIVSIDRTDGYHTNLISGYINALMTYCSITGESAENKIIPSVWKITPTKDVDESKLNYIAIFELKDNMHGLQTLADEYLTNRTCLNM